MRGLQPWSRHGVTLSAASRETEALRHLVVRGGAFVHEHLALGVGSRGRGFFAQRALRAGEVVASVPELLTREFSLHSQSATARALTDLERFHRSEGLASTALLTLRLLKDGTHDTSVFRAYRALLPPPCDESIEAAASTDFAEHCEDIRCGLEIRVPTAKFLGLMRRAQSRFVGGELTPVLDLVNHDPTPNAALSQGSLTLERNIEEGEELTRSYGELGNAELMLNYGFALEDNKHDSILLPHAAVQLPVRPSVMYVEPAPIVGDVLTMAQSMPLNALRRARSACVSMEDVVNAACRGVGGKINFDLPISVRNESESLLYVADAVQARLDLYQTDALADSESLLTVKNIAERHAIITRLGEKRIYLESLKNIKQRRIALGDNDDHRPQSRRKAKEPPAPW